MQIQFTQQTIKQYEKLLTFKPNPIAQLYLMSPAHIRAIIKGNQGGGTAISAYDACLRLLGIHPVPEKNRVVEPIRFVTKCKPDGPEDRQNQQYVEFMNFFPKELILNEITARNNILNLKDPYGGANRHAEFMSNNQDIDAFMSVPRSALYQDEEIDRMKWDECNMRLAVPASKGEGGDVTICLTPVKGLEWTFDSIWKRAERVYRSDIICEKFGFPAIEETGIMGSGIEAFCWATDDNPVMTPEALEVLFSHIVDDEALALRRYAVFRQVSGLVYKSFDSKVHVVPYDKVYNGSMFRHYWHFRVIDYHPQKPWFVSFVAVTPTHEWFVWKELLGNHHVMTTLDIRDEIKAESLVDEDEMFNRATLVDPLAKVKQPNTGWSVFQDLSMGEEGLRRMVAADTKNENGRESIMIRLKNSLICGVPGNNISKSNVTDLRYGQYKPTIWFMDRCKGHIDHFRSWRYVDYKQEHTIAVKTTKRLSEKYSDYCRNMEFLGAHGPIWYDMRPAGEYKRSELFQGRRG